jgi:hypothetical protein
MASSGPASHDATLRGFEEHQDHARAGEDAMLEFEALADTIGYLAVGDMVLSAIASTFLGRWGVPFADDNPWPDFMTEVDARILHGDDRAILRAARELDLDLREARHRIAAHRRRAHAEILSWGLEDVLTIDLANPELQRIDPVLLESLGLETAQAAPAETDQLPDPLHEAIGLLEAADGRLREAVEASPRGRLPARRSVGAGSGTVQLADLFERLHGHAGWLDGEARRLVRNAHRIAGYESVHPARVVAAALRATADITGARDSSDADHARDG